ncbi:MAG: SpoIIE family protein phosphatase [Chlamydiota bacterium]
MRKEKKKNSFWRIKESLVSRVLLIAFLLIVIPFFLLISFQYYEDIKSERTGALVELNLITREVQKQIRQAILQRKDLLDIVDLLLEPTEEAIPDLAIIAAQVQAMVVIHLTANAQGKYVCDTASKREFIGKDYSLLMEKGLSGQTFGYWPQSKEFFLLSEITKGKSAWVAFFATQSLVKDWEISVESSLAIDISLVGEDKQVIITTNPQLHEKIATLKDRAIKEGSLFLEGANFIVAERALLESHVLLLVSAPSKVNFTDIPNFFLKLAVSAVIVILLGGLGTLVLSYYLSRPFKKLSSVMQQVGQGNLDLRFKPSSLGFEVNILGKIFNDVVTALVQRIEEVKRERVEKETLAQELLIGQEVHNSIIPRKLPRFSGIDIAAHFISAQEVGGDFYDFLSKQVAGRRQLLFAIADTSGKGIYACLYSLTIRSILRSYGLISHRLEEILQQVNALFCRDTADSGVFVTMWVGIFDQKTRMLTFSNCGHHPALLKRADGSVMPLSTSGMALGAVSDVTIEAQSVQLLDGDLLLAFTDGVVEAHNDRMEMFGENRIIQILQAQKEENAQEVVDALMEKVSFFAGGAPQHDDLTVIAVKVLALD